MKLFFTILCVLFSQVLVCAQSDKGVADAKPRFEFSYEVFSTKIEDIRNKYKEGTKEFFEALLEPVKDYPRNMEPYHTVLNYASRISDDSLRNWVHKELLKLANKEIVPIFITFRIRGMVELQKAVAIPNPKERYTALEKFLEIGSKVYYPDSIIIEALKKLDQPEYERDSKPSYQEASNKLQVKLRNAFGLEWLKIAEAGYLQLIQDHPRRLGPYRGLLRVAKFSDDSKRYKIYQNLLNIGDKAHPVLARYLKGLVELQKAMLNPNKIEGYRTLEILSLPYDTYGTTLVDELSRSASVSRRQLKFEMDLISKPLDIKFDNFEALDGRKVDLSKMKGKVVLINFWAVWCHPCVKNIPNIKKVYDKYHKSGFEVVGISRDRSRERLESFVNKNNLDWPQFFDGKGDMEDHLAKKYKIYGVPEYWLVDKEGYLVNMRAGYDLEEKVEKLLR